MSELQSYTQKFSEIIRLIESNNIDISSHNSNKRIAHTGVALSYLLTNNSKSQTTRTLGQVGALGGLMYGSTEANKSNTLRDKNFQQVSEVIEIISKPSFNAFQIERNSENRRLFLMKMLTISGYLDDYVKKYCSSVSTKNFLGSSGQTLLMNLQNQEIFYLKLKLNSFFNKVDNSKCNGDFVNKYIQKNSNLNKKILKKESLIIMIFLLTFILLGFYSPIFFLATPIIYAVHTFFPFMKESKKLKTHSKYFKNEILKTIPVTNINY